MPIKKDVTIGDCRLILGDALEVMPLLGKVDAVVTDPPYELSKNGAGKSHFGMSLNKFDSKEYKNIINGVDYEDIFNCIKLCCDKLNGFIFCSNKQISNLMTVAEKHTDSVTLLVWHKTNAAPFANGVWKGDIEYIIHFREKGTVFNGNASKKNKVIPHPIVMEKSHPTVKPLPIIRRLIENCSNSEQTILDPYMGSGTTLVACAKMGRKGIGIELDEDYFNIACKRVADAYKQPDMLIEQPKAKLEQDTMEL